MRARLSETRRRCHDHTVAQIRRKPRSRNHAGPTRGGRVSRAVFPLVTWQWRAPLVVGDCACGSVSFARLTLH
eukprot:2094416-Pyramimonas_sp.AAC.1